MYDVLRKHAIDNVWCSPAQDNQVIVRAKRVTRPGGEFISATVMLRNVKLPSTDVRYHIYQLGYVHPVLLGLLPRRSDWMVPAWVNFSEAVNELALFADLYSDRGVHSPLHRSYYMYTEDRALIFAVPQLRGLDLDLYRENIYLRLYTNAYYSSSEASALPVLTQTSGRTAMTVSDITQIQSLVTGFRQSQGAVYCYVNGNLVDSISPLTAKVGDILEYVYDASVKEVVDLTVKDLVGFNSALDGQMKFLLHRTKTEDAGQIEFVDDIDLYVMYGGEGQRIGRYFHRNDIENHRMVTHRDHSVSVTSYTHIQRSMAESLQELPPGPDGYFIRMYVRRSGLNRPLVYENQRIFELYKMSDDQIVSAMSGLGSTLEMWKASSLESCAYTLLMRIDQKLIDIGLVEDAYGYNAMGKILGDSPIKTRPYSERKLATLPISYQKNTTIYEYDENGKLLGYYPTSSRNEWFCVNNNAALIEPVVGTGSESLPVQMGKNNLHVKPGYSYRVYKASVFEGVVQDDWEDITGSDDYVIVDNMLQWRGVAVEYMLQVRTDEKFLAYSLELDTVAGTLYFDLTEIIAGQKRLMALPAGRLDVWLNGAPLINQLDVIVDFPRVYIVSKEHIAQPAHSTKQRVDIRFTGFCESDMKLQPPQDYGWIEHGYLSNNNQFDLRDDKVLRIQVRGSLKTRDVLEFSEEHRGVSMRDSENGSPYQIVQTLVPLRDHAEAETYSLLEKSRAIDHQVSQYLTQKLPQPPRGNITVIPNRYQLVSPFFAHLISDLQNDQFDKAAIQNDVNDNKVLELCAPYEWLLKFDPVSDEIGIDLRYVVIHPHFLTTHIGLDLVSYRFMQKVARLYGRQKVVLNNHLVVDVAE